MGDSHAFNILLPILCIACTDAQKSNLSPPYTCTTTTTLCQPGTDDSTRPNTGAQASQGRPGKRGAAGEKGERGERGNPRQCDIADEEAIRSLRKTMNLKFEKLQDQLSLIALPSNCAEYQMLLNKDDGNSEELTKIYPFKHIGNPTYVLVNCNLYQVDSDGWIIIQKRYNGSVDFSGDWETYARGFGERDGEFWLGLRTLHQITSHGNFQLRIDLVLQSGSVKYAEYSTFAVGNENSKFRLTVSGYSGDTDDRMTYHSGHGFTTLDMDDDKHTAVNCAAHFHGAWWHNSCYHSNLNGRYITDFDWPHGTHLSSSEMKIRLI
ncbi:ficolin-3-like [Styela clava]